MPKQRSFSDEQLRLGIEAVASMSALLRYLNLKQSGGNHYWLAKIVRNLGLDISHWTGQAYRKGSSWPNPTKIPLEDILVVNSSYRCNHTLKKRLVSANLLKYECSECGITVWRGKPLSLHLHHKNGNNTDNRLDNLCLLCPNCHDLTENHSSKKPAPKKPRKQYYCGICNITISRWATRCRACARNAKTSVSNLQKCPG